MLMAQERILNIVVAGVKYNQKWLLIRRERGSYQQKYALVGGKMDVDERIKEALLREIKEETTILFSTHVLHDAEEISDDILIMHAGQIAISGSLESVMEEYRQPIVQIELESQANEWLKDLSSYSFVSEVNSQGNKTSIVLKDMVNGKQALLKEIVDKKLPVRKFEMSQTTLEDLFMKVVKA